MVTLCVRSWSSRLPLRPVGCATGEEVGVPAAVKIVGGGPVTLRDGHISNSDIGVQSTGNAPLTAENMSFEDVRQAWDLPGPAPAEISGTRITSPRPTARSESRTSVGWRRPMGPPLPAFCPRCKSVFPSRNYVTGSPRFHSRDNDETCPSCGFGRAKLSDGLFDLSRDVIRVLAALTSHTRCSPRSRRSTSKRSPAN